MEALHKLLQEGVASGEVQPLPLTVFTHAQSEDAFRYMAKGDPWTLLLHGQMVPIYDCTPPSISEGILHLLLEFSKFRITSLPFFQMHFLSHCCAPSLFGGRKGLVAARGGRVLSGEGGRKVSTTCFNTTSCKTI